MKSITELRQQREELQKAMGAYMHELSNWDDHIEKIRQEGYQKGLEDAWELAGKVTLPPSQEGMTAEEILECFDVANEWYVLRSPVSVAKEMYDTWKGKKEQQKADEIRVGDVVKDDYEFEFVVTKNIKNDIFSAVRLDNGGCVVLAKNSITKTGKHYDLPWLQEKENEPD